MQKPAETRYPVHDLINNRWSPRAFSARPVDAESIGSLLEAARWAPSSYNEQPWTYFVASRSQTEAYDKLLNCLSEGNRPWAGQAPVLMLAVAKLQFDRNGKPNRHAQHDVGLANENLVLQATAMGLIVHQMAGFDPEAARRTLHVPDGHEPLTMLAVGYHGDADDLPEPYREREEAPRSRKQLVEFVFTDTWGAASSLVTG